MLTKDRKKTAENTFRKLIIPFSNFAIIIDLEQVITEKL